MCLNYKLNKFSFIQNTVSNMTFVRVTLNKHMCVQINSSSVTYYPYIAQSPLVGIVPKMFREIDIQNCITIVEAQFQSKLKMIINITYDYSKLLQCHVSVVTLLMYASTSSRRRVYCYLLFFLSH